MTDTFKSRWIVCDDCECVTVIERDDARGVPDENEWEEFGRCLVCGSSQLHWNADQDTIADRYWRLGHKAAGGVPVTAPVLATRHALAKSLYEMFGRHLYGHDIGPWESARVEPEQWRWTNRADALLASGILRDPATLADDEELVERLVEAKTSPFISQPEAKAGLRALAAALTEDPS